MISFKRYVQLSFASVMAMLYHSLSSKEQYYPAMVYFSSSPIGIVILLNMGLANMCMLWKLTKCLFLGTLREEEIERLNEQAWREFLEMFFAVTIFRHNFTFMSFAMVTALLLIKSLHWLALKRVEYIETTPNIILLSHIRIVSFNLFLLVLDCLFLQSSLKSVIKTWQVPAVYLSFEYTILASTIMATFVKYVFYVTDMLMEGQWQKKPMFTFYLELIRDLFNLSLYIISFPVIFICYGVPLHSIRELSETFRSFRNRISDYIRYREVTSNMEERYPDATPEELNAGDETCIICREDMITAKRLLCGHIFHMHCLRSWLERQNTCPTCRALVVPPETGPGRSQQQHRGGSAEASTSRQRSENHAADDYLNQHQARVRAAVAAASVYEKSLIYPAAYAWFWPPGSLLQPPVLNGYLPAGYSFLYTQNIVGNPELKASMLMVHEMLIKTRIEILYSVLQSLQQQNADQAKMGSGNEDLVDKGKGATVGSDFARGET